MDSSSANGQVCEDVDLVGARLPVIGAEYYGISPAETNQPTVDRGQKRRDISHNGLASLVRDQPLEVWATPQ